MGENASMGAVDRISELPDFILHHILSFLWTKEAARTCLVSKRWKYIWETFPILDCNQTFFGRFLYLTNPREIGLPKNERRRIFGERVKFVSSVDHKLQYLYERSLRVKKFHLDMTLVSIGLFPNVDSWLDLVTRLSVQELELRLTSGRHRFYILPLKVLASQSLIILSLRGCLLDYCYYTSAVNLCSLRELHLQDTYIDGDTIRYLVTSIQSIEVLSLKNCFGFTQLLLHGDYKIKKIIYHPHKDIKVTKFHINLSNLEELDFHGVDKEENKFEIIIDPACRNLKSLCLCGIFIDTKWLQDTISSFPLLQRLFLGGCAVKEGCLKLSSSILKELYLRNFTNLMEAVFDIPELRMFLYHGKNMPRLSLNDVSGNRTAEVSIHLKNMDNSWFIKLNNFLRDNRFQDLTVFITARKDYVMPFDAEDLKGLQVPPAFEFKTLKLDVHAFTTVKYASILDGLLWHLRPRILSLELNHHSPEFLKGLLKSLVVEEEPICCCSKNFECWRHSLKGITFLDVKGFENGSPLDLYMLRRLNNYLDDWATKAQIIMKSYGQVSGEILSFHLLW